MKCLWILRTGEFTLCWESRSQEVRNGRQWCPSNSPLQVASIGTGGSIIFRVNDPSLQECFSHGGLNTKASDVNETRAGLRKLMLITILYNPNADL